MTMQPSVPLADHLEIFALLHGAMRRDAQRFCDALAAVEPKDRKAVRRLRQWYTRFEDALGHHHRLEDDYFWPALRSRAPAFAEVESTMHSEHHQLEAALAGVSRGLAELTRADEGGWAAAYASARQATSRFQTVLVGHLADEEATALTLMGTHLSPEEFAAVDKQAQRAAGLGYVAFALPWLLDGLTAEEGAHLLQPAPRPFRWLLRLWWQPRYRRLTAPFRTLS
jgi:hemerythrin-like domain-containing protein